MEKVRIVNLSTGEAKFVSSVTAGKVAFLKSMGFIVQDMPKIEPVLDESKNQEHEAKPRATRGRKAKTETIN